MPHTVVVIPCYNEERRLDVRCFQEFLETCYDVELLFVNDGSTDRTLHVLENLQWTYPNRFSVYDLPYNVGKAEAVRQGMLVAFRRNPTYVGFWDADLATPLNAITQFQRVLQQRPECQLVMGSRIRLLGHFIERRRLRHILGRLFATTASFVLGFSVYDTQCGAKMFRVDSDTEALFKHPFHSRWIFDVELLARMIRKRRLLGQSLTGQEIYELPLDEWRDIDGSNVKTRDFVKALGELSKIYWEYLRRAEVRPLVVESATIEASQQKTSSNGTSQTKRKAA